MTEKLGYLVTDTAGRTSFVENIAGVYWDTAAKVVTVCAMPSQSKLPYLEDVRERCMAAAREVLSNRDTSSWSGWPGYALIVDSVLDEALAQFGIQLTSVYQKGQK